MLNHIFYGTTGKNITQSFLSFLCVFNMFLIILSLLLLIIQFCSGITDVRFWFIECISNNQFIKSFGLSKTSMDNMGNILFGLFNIVYIISYEVEFVFI